MRYTKPTLLFYTSMCAYGTLYSNFHHKEVLNTLWFMCLFAYVIYLISNLIFWNKPKAGLEMNTLISAACYFIILFLFRVYRLVFDDPPSTIIFLGITIPFFILNTFYLWSGLKKKRST